MIVWLIVFGKRRGEEGSEGVGREGGLGEGIKGGEGVGDDALQVLGLAEVLLERGVRLAEAALNAGAFLSSTGLDAGEIAQEGLELHLMQLDEGRGWERASLVDGGGVGAVVLAEAGELEEGEGVTLGEATFFQQEAAGGGVQRRLLRVEKMAEAGEAAVFEGVEVAGSGTSTGAPAAAT